MDETSSVPLVSSGWAGEVKNFHFSRGCREACLSVSPALPFCWGLSHGLASSALRGTLLWLWLVGFGFPLLTGVGF